MSRSSSPIYSVSDFDFDFDTSSCPSPTDSRRSSLDGPHPDLPPLTTSDAPLMPLKRPLRSAPSFSTPLSPSKQPASPTKRRDNSLSTRSSARMASPRTTTSFSPVKGAPELRFPTPMHTSTPASPPFPPPFPASLPAEMARSTTKSPGAVRRAVPPQYEECSVRRPQSP
jgi:hypothetical protein